MILVHAAAGRSIKSAVGLISDFVVMALEIAFFLADLVNFFRSSIRDAQKREYGSRL